MLISLLLIECQNMLFLRSVLLVVSVVAVVVLAEDKYSVPDPNIEVFSPKGLRVSIPDSKNIRFVQFFFSFTKPVVDNDPGTVAKEVDDKQGSYWIYYNPSVVLKEGDKLFYKINVNNDGICTFREGTHHVAHVVSLADNLVVNSEDGEDDQGQQHLSSFPFSNHEEPGQTSGVNRGQMKSAYSMYKSMETKPITRSSTTTTSGTFYVKPTGDLEASGFKSASSYDSTRRDGEQWQHSKTELSAAEIEDLSRIHGKDFLSLPAFSHLGLEGGSSSSSYRSSSSYSSSSGTKPQYGSALSYHQSGQTSEMLPLIRNPAGLSSYSKYEQHESSRPLISPGGAVYSSSDTSYGQVPELQPASFTQEFESSGTNPSGYSTAQTKYHRQETVKTSSSPQIYSTGTNPSDTYGRAPILPASLVHQEYESSSGSNPAPYSTTQTKYHRQETVKTSSVPQTYPTGGATNKVSETYEYKSPVNTIILPISRQPVITYNGVIFQSTVQPTSPSSCSNFDYGYKTASQVDVVTLEKSVNEVQCLASLAEKTMKAEVYALKEANTNLVNRLNELQEQFQKFRTQCKCY